MYAFDMQMRNAAYAKYIRPSGAGPVYIRNL